MSRVTAGYQAVLEAIVPLVAERNPAPYLVHWGAGTATISSLETRTPMPDPSWLANVFTSPRGR